MIHQESLADQAMSYGPDGVAAPRIVSPDATLAAPDRPERWSSPSTSKAAGITGVFDPAVFPEELRSCRQWVTWRLENRGQKPTKVPYCAATGRAANTKDPRTWTSFQAAFRAFESGKFGGVGFVFSAADPYCGIDLDNSVEDSGAVKPWAQEILDLLPAGSYIERSPSGRGLHALIRAKKPGSKCRTPIEDGAIEIYDRDRYFTMTGCVLAESSVHLVESQSALDRVYQRFFALPPNLISGRSSPGNSELLSRMFASKNGAAIRVLWDGDASGYPSESEADLALCSHLAFWIGSDGEQIDAWFRRSGLMRDKWLRDDYRERTIAKALGSHGASRETAITPGREDQKRPQAVREISVGGLDPLDEAISPASHRANAGRLARQFKRELCFSPGLGFLVYDRRRWRVSQSQAERLAGRLGRIISAEAAHLHRRAANTEDENSRRKYQADAEVLAAWARTSEQGQAIRESLNLAKGLLEVESGHFDAHDFLLNVENGTLDLKTGTLRAHSPDDFLTKQAPVIFDPKAVAPKWRSFIKDITGGDPGLMRYLQKGLAYSITGSVAEQCMFFCHGDGLNGKTTLLDTIRQVVGDEYVIKGASDLLITQPRSSAHPTAVADLQGARLVVCQEVGRGKTFDAQKLKELTGERSLKARRMHQDNFSFRATFKIWLGANHLPEVNDESEGFWRRMRLIPFEVRIEKPVLDLPQRLLEERSGILNWLLEGLRLYLEEGLEPPEEVVRAGGEYRETSDSLRQFVENHCLVGAGLSVKAGEFESAYQEYCRSRSFEAIGHRGLRGAMNRLGFEQPPRRKAGYFYAGLELAEASKAVSPHGRGEPMNQDEPISINLSKSLS